MVMFDVLADIFSVGRHGYRMVSKVKGGYRIVYSRNWLTITTS